MTSPAHAHNDPHGKLLKKCDADADDFEDWGWCAESPIFTNPTFHICDYVNVEGCTTFGPPYIRSLLQNQLETLFGGVPQVAPVRTGDGFVHAVAEEVYRFTTFKGTIVTNVFTQPDSELHRMFPFAPIPYNPLVPGLLDPLIFHKEWYLQDGVLDSAFVGNTTGILLGGIFDPGHSNNHCGRSERILGELAWEVFDEERWWPMENPDGSENGPECDAVYEEVCGPFGNCVPTPFLDKIVANFYIENSGGGLVGANGLTPRVYEKSLYNTANNTKTLLRIYGDTLYPMAVAYGAGLLQVFIEDVIQPPIADAGGDYEAILCAPVVLDGSGSSDSNGEIVSYEWDLEDDGTFDVSSTSSTQFAPSKPKT